jgi:hypothetical protein
MRGGLMEDNYKNNRVSKGKIEANVDPHTSY